jgi:SAM-dependent methyltransferase
VGLLSDLHFPDHHFDVVLAASVFEHLQEPKKDLAQIRRILKPGGLLYVGVPNYRTLPIMFGKDDFFLNQPPQHVNYFTPTTLRVLLKDAGFRNVRISTGYGLKWEILFGLPVRSPITEAYQAHWQGGEQGSTTTKSSPRGSARSWLKKLIVRAVIQPIFYRWLKVGYGLLALARQP